MAQVTEVVTNFSFKGSIKPLMEYTVTLSGAVFLGQQFIAGLQSIGGWLNEMTVQVLRDADALTQLSEKTGIATVELQRLQGLGEISGVGADTLLGSMESLTTKIGEAAVKGSEDFARLGISVRDEFGRVKSSTRVLDEIRARFNQLNLSTQERKGFAEALGLDGNVLPLLNKTDAEMAALNKRIAQYGKLTDEQVAQNKAFNESLRESEFALGKIQEQIAVVLAPELQMITDAFNEFLAANKELFVEIAQNVIGIIKEATKVFERWLPVLKVLAASFVIAKVAALGFSGVMGILLSPVVLITAGITSLLLIVDDLIVAFDGGKSVIRDFVQEWTGFDIAELPNMLARGVEILIGKLDKAKQVFADLVQWFKDAFATIGRFVGRATELASSIGGGVVDFFGGGASNSTTDNSVNQQISIEVRSDDPQAAGQAVNDALQRELEKTQTYNNRGGR